jgi:hypothetical protein
MSDVMQINNSCFLACLESFLHDQGIHIEQECMIKILTNKGLCTDEGIVYFEKMNEVCKILNIKICQVDYHYPIEKKYEDGSLLMGTTIPGFHCMRFLQQLEGKIFVMDPQVGTSHYWDKQDIEDSKPNYYHIEIFDKR